MYPAYLDLPDRTLVEAMHRLEAHTHEDDKALGRFCGFRSELSRQAWHSITEEIGCDSGPLSKVGVMVFPLDEGLAARLLNEMMASPRDKMRRKDFALGYVSTGQSQCDYLNACNQYRKITPATHALLEAFLAEAGPMIEANVGHPYRIASRRQFQLVPNRPLADKHLDGWPVGIRKIFVLPQGCGRRSSTTWFQLRDGTELTVESDKPIWMIFENSVVWHAPISGVALRPTIEFDIVPARRTSFEPFDAGLGGWYPHFPTEAELLAGTRTALQRFLEVQPEGAPVKSWLQRLRGSVGPLRKPAA